MAWPSWLRMGGSSGASSVAPMARTTRAFKWTIIAFGLFSLAILGIIIWQLDQTSPGRYCGLAQVTSPEGSNACVSLLLKILEVKGNVLYAMTAIIGVVIIALTVVAVGVGVKVSASTTGLNVDIDQVNTTVTDNAGSSVVVPTPPTEAPIPDGPKGASE